MDIKHPSTPLQPVSNANTLPVMMYQREIAKSLQNTKTLVIRAPTGTGKSSLLPVFLSKLPQAQQIVIQKPKDNERSTTNNATTISTKTKIDSNTTSKTPMTEEHSIHHQSSQLSNKIGYEDMVTLNNTLYFGSELVDQPSELYNSITTSSTKNFKSSHHGVGAPIKSTQRGSESKRNNKDTKPSKISFISPITTSQKLTHFTFQPTIPSAFTFPTINKAIDMNIITDTDDRLNEVRIGDEKRENDVEIPAFASALCIETQPRTISAFSVAKRVAEELETKYFNSLSFQYRVDNNQGEDDNQKKSSSSSLPQQQNQKPSFALSDIVHNHPKYGYIGHFVGLVLSETQVIYNPYHCKVLIVLDVAFLQIQQNNDPLLRNCKHLIVDEAHERSIYSDIILSISKKLLRLRREFILRASRLPNPPQIDQLYVVISSATIDAEKFLHFMDEKTSKEASQRQALIEEEMKKNPNGIKSPFATKSLLSVSESATKGLGVPFSPFLPTTSPFSINSLSPYATAVAPVSSTLPILVNHHQHQKMQRDSGMNQGEDGVRFVDDTHTYTIFSTLSTPAPPPNQRYLYNIPIPSPREPLQFKNTQDFTNLGALLSPFMMGNQNERNALQNAKMNFLLGKKSFYLRHHTTSIKGGDGGLTSTGLAGVLDYKPSESRDEILLDGSVDSSNPNQLEKSTQSKRSLDLTLITSDQLTPLGDGTHLINQNDHNDHITNTQSPPSPSLTSSIMTPIGSSQPYLDSFDEQGAGGKNTNSFYQNPIDIKTTNYKVTTEYKPIPTFLAFKEQYLTDQFNKKMRDSDDSGSETSASESESEDGGDITNETDGNVPNKVLPKRRRKRDKRTKDAKKATTNLSDEDQAQQEQKILLEYCIIHLIPKILAGMNEYYNTIDCETGLPVSNYRPSLATSSKETLVFLRNSSDVFTLANLFNAILFPLAVTFSANLDFETLKKLEKIRSDEKFQDILSKLSVISLYHGMSESNQAEVFTQIDRLHARNATILLLSDSISETGLTFPNLKLVIDTGRFINQCYSFTHRCELNLEEFIPQSQQLQRRGRVGRCANGHCIYLYNQTDITQQYQLAESQRKQLGAALLLLTKFGIFIDFSDSPSTNGPSLFGSAAKAQPGSQNDQESVLGHADFAILDNLNQKSTTPINDPTLTQAPLRSDITRIKLIDTPAVEYIKQTYQQLLQFGCLTISSSKTGAEYLVNDDYTAISQSNTTTTSFTSSYQTHGKQLIISSDELLDALILNTEDYKIDLTIKGNVFLSSAVDLEHAQMIYSGLQSKSLWGGLMLFLVTTVIQGSNRAIFETFLFSSLRSIDQERTNMWSLYARIQHILAEYDRAKAIDHYYTSGAASRDMANQLNTKTPGSKNHPPAKPQQQQQQQQQKYLPIPISPSTILSDDLRYHYLTYVRYASGVWDEFRSVLEGGSEFLTILWLFFRWLYHVEPSCRDCLSTISTLHTKMNGRALYPLPLGLMGDYGCGGTTRSSGAFGMENNSNNGPVQNTSNNKKNTQKTKPSQQPLNPHLLPQDNNNHNNTNASSVNYANMINSTNLTPQPFPSNFPFHLFHPTLSNVCMSTPPLNCTSCQKTFAGRYSLLQDRLVQLQDALDGRLELLLPLMYHFYPHLKTTPIIPPHDLHRRNLLRFGLGHDASVSKSDMQYMGKVLESVDGEKKNKQKKGLDEQLQESEQSEQSKGHADESKEDSHQEQQSSRLVRIVKLHELAGQLYNDDITGDKLNTDLKPHFGSFFESFSPLVSEVFINTTPNRISVPISANSLLNGCILKVNSIRDKADESDSDDEDDDDSEDENGDDSVGDGNKEGKKSSSSTSRKSSKRDKSASSSKSDKKSTSLSSSSASKKSSIEKKEKKERKMRKRAKRLAKLEKAQTLMDLSDIFGDEANQLDETRLNNVHGLFNRPKLVGRAVNRSDNRGLDTTIIKANLSTLSTTLMYTSVYHNSLDIDPSVFIVVGYNAVAASKRAGGDNQELNLNDSSGVSADQVELPGTTIESSKTLIQPTSLLKNKLTDKSAQKQQERSDLNLLCTVDLLHLICLPQITSTNRNLVTKMMNSIAIKPLYIFPNVGIQIYQQLHQFIVSLQRLDSASTHNTTVSINLTKLIEANKKTTTTSSTTTSSNNHKTLLVELPPSLLQYINDPIFQRLIVNVELGNYGPSGINTVALQHGNSNDKDIVLNASGNTKPGSLSTQPTKKIKVKDWTQFVGLDYRTRHINISNHTGDSDSDDDGNVNNNTNNNNSNTTNAPLGQQSDAQEEASLASTQQDLLSRLATRQRLEQYGLDADTEVSAAKPLSLAEIDVFGEFVKRLEPELAKKFFPVHFYIVIFNQPQFQPIMSYILTKWLNRIRASHSKSQVDQGYVHPILGRNVMISGLETSQQSKSISSSHHPELLTRKHIIPSYKSHLDLSVPMVLYLDRHFNVLDSQINLPLLFETEHSNGPNDNAITSDNLITNHSLSDDGDGDDNDDSDIDNDDEEEEHKRTNSKHNFKGVPPRLPMQLLLPSLSKMASSIRSNRSGDENISENPPTRDDCKMELIKGSQNHIIPQTNPQAVLVAPKPKPFALYPRLQVKIKSILTHFTTTSDSVVTIGHYTKSPPDLTHDGNNTNNTSNDQQSITKAPPIDHLIQTTVASSLFNNGYIPPQFLMAYIHHTLHTVNLLFYFTNIFLRFPPLVDHQFNFSSKDQLSSISTVIPQVFKLPGVFGKMFQHPNNPSTTDSTSVGAEFLGCTHNCLCCCDCFSSYSEWVDYLVDFSSSSNVPPTTESFLKQYSSECQQQKSNGATTNTIGSNSSTKTPEDDHGIDTDMMDGLLEDTTTNGPKINSGNISLRLGVVLNSSFSTLVSMVNILQLLPLLSPQLSQLDRLFLEIEKLKYEHKSKCLSNKSDEHINDHDQRKPSCAEEIIFPSQEDHHDDNNDSGSLIIPSQSVSIPIKQTTSGSLKHPHLTSLSSRSDLWNAIKTFFTPFSLIHLFTHTNLFSFVIPPSSPSYPFPPVARSRFDYNNETSIVPRQVNNINDPYVIIEAAPHAKALNQWFDAFATSTTTTTNIMALPADITSMHSATLSTTRSSHSGFELPSSRNINKGFFDIVGKSILPTVTQQLLAQPAKITVGVPFPSSIFSNRAGYGLDPISAIVNKKNPAIGNILSVSVSSNFLYADFIVVRYARFLGSIRDTIITMIKNPLYNKISVIKLSDPTGSIGQGSRNPLNDLKGDFSKGVAKLIKKRPKKQINNSTNTTNTTHSKPTLSSSVGSPLASVEDDNDNDERSNDFDDERDDLGVELFSAEDSTLFAQNSQLNDNPTTSSLLNVNEGDDNDDSDNDDDASFATKTTSRPIDTSKQSTTILYYITSSSPSQLNQFVSALQSQIKPTILTLTSTPATLYLFQQTNIIDYLEAYFEHRLVKLEYDRSQHTIHIFGNPIDRNSCVNVLNELVLEFNAIYHHNQYSLLGLLISVGDMDLIMKLEQLRSIIISARDKKVGVNVYQSQFLFDGKDSSSHDHGKDGSHATKRPNPTSLDHRSLLQLNRRTHIISAKNDAIPPLELIRGRSPPQSSNSSSMGLGAVRETPDLIDNDVKTNETAVSTHYYYVEVLPLREIFPATPIVTHTLRQATQQHSTKTKRNVSAAYQMFQVHGHLGIEPEEIDVINQITLELQRFFDISTNREKDSSHGNNSNHNNHNQTGSYKSSHKVISNNIGMQVLNGSIAASTQGGSNVAMSVFLAQKQALLSQTNGTANNGTVGAIKNGSATSSRNNAFGGNQSGLHSLAVLYASKSKTKANITFLSCDLCNASNNPISTSFAISNNIISLTNCGHRVCSNCMQSFLKGAIKAAQTLVKQQIHGLHMCLKCPIHALKFNTGNEQQFTHSSNLHKDPTSSTNQAMVKMFKSPLFHSNLFRYFVPAQSHPTQELLQLMRQVLDMEDSAEDDGHSATTSTTTTTTTAPQTTKTMSLRTIMSLQAYMGDSEFASRADQISLMLSNTGAVDLHCCQLPLPATDVLSSLQMSQWNEVLESLFTLHTSLAKLEMSTEEFLIQEFKDKAALESTDGLTHHQNHQHHHTHRDHHHHHHPHHHDSQSILSPQLATPSLLSTKSITITSSTAGSLEIDLDDQELSISHAIRCSDHRCQTLIPLPLAAIESSNDTIHCYNCRAPICIACHSLKENVVLMMETNNDLMSGDLCIQPTQSPKIYEKMLLEPSISHNEITNHTLHTMINLYCTAISLSTERIQQYFNTNTTSLDYLTNKSSNPGVFKNTFAYLRDHSPYALVPATSQYLLSNRSFLASASSYSIKTEFLYRFMIYSQLLTPALIWLNRDWPRQHSVDPSIADPNQPLFTIDRIGASPLALNQSNDFFIPNYNLLLHTPVLQRFLNGMSYKMHYIDFNNFSSAGSGKMSSRGKNNRSKKNNDEDESTLLSGVQAPIMVTDDNPTYLNFLDNMMLHHNEINNDGIDGAEFFETGGLGEASSTSASKSTNSNKSSISATNFNAGKVIQNFHHYNQAPVTPVAMDVGHYYRLRRLNTTNASSATASSTANLNPLSLSTANALHKISTLVPDDKLTHMPPQWVKSTEEMAKLLSRFHNNPMYNTNITYCYHGSGSLDNYRSILRDSLCPFFRGHHGLVHGVGEYTSMESDVAISYADSQYYIVLSMLIEISNVSPGYCYVTNSDAAWNSSYIIPLGLINFHAVLGYSDGNCWSNHKANTSYRQQTTKRKIINHDKIKAPTLRYNDPFNNGRAVTTLFPHLLPHIDMIEGMMQIWAHFRKHGTVDDVVTYTSSNSNDPSKSQQQQQQPALNYNLQTPNPNSLNDLFNHDAINGGDGDKGSMKIIPAPQAIIQTMTKQERLRLNQYLDTVELHMLRANKGNSDAIMAKDRSDKLARRLDRLLGVSGGHEDKKKEVTVDEKITATVLTLLHVMTLPYNPQNALQTGGQNIGVKSILGSASEKEKKQSQNSFKLDKEFTKNVAEFRLQSQQQGLSTTGGSSAGLFRFAGKLFLSQFWFLWKKLLIPPPRQFKIISVEKQTSESDPNDKLPIGPKSTDVRETVSFLEYHRSFSYQLETVPLAQKFVWQLLVNQFLHLKAKSQQQHDSEREHKSSNSNNNEDDTNFI